MQTTASFYGLSASDHFDCNADVQASPSLVCGQSRHAEFSRQGKTCPISKRQPEGPSCRAHVPNGIRLGSGKRPDIERKASEHVLHLLDAQAPLTQLGHDLGEIGCADYRCGQSLQNAFASRLPIQEAKKGRGV